MFTKQNGEDGIEVRIYDEDVWLTQKRMGRLFICGGEYLEKYSNG